MQKIDTDTYILETNGKTFLLTDGRLVLIDTGTKQDGELLIPELKKTGYDPTDIQHIIITHAHPDHRGGLATMSKISGARIASHEIEAKFISKEEIYDGPPGAQSQGAPGAKVVDLLKDGDIYEGLLVIHTPGHTPGHIALLDTEKDMLIAGDAFRNDPAGLNHMPDMFNQNPTEHRKSIKKLADYSFTTALVGHGDPVLANASHLLSKLVDTFDL